MLKFPAMPFQGRSDAELVSDTLAGNRSAFAEIVSRYQTLVCSVAYSATGDLSRSEDLAQETFLVVWQQLPELREPEKLRAWICGIVRNRARQAYRGEHRQPTFQAETLEHAGEAVALEAQPSDEAVSRDETAIMWRALEQIPEIYREPLILFHRENQSVERVAAALDLSEDAVKQRLVRGRKLLQAEVEAVVEGALRRSVPGPAFTSSVMEALPAAATVAKAGTMTAKVAIGAGAVAKGSIGGGLFGLATAMLSSAVPPLFILFFQRKLGLATEAATVAADERALMKKKRQGSAAYLLTAVVLLTLFRSWVTRQTRLPWFGPLIPLAIGFLMLFSIVRTLQIERRLRQIQATSGKAPLRRKWEYRSRQSWWGLPLVHIRLGFDPRWLDAAAPVKAWIAVGQVSYGVILACGTVAVAPVGVGIISLGFVSVGGCAMGGLALGMFLAFGMFACGLNAIGWKAMGLCSFGLRAAYGLAAYAGTYAGFPAKHSSKLGLAYAAHPNDPDAMAFFAQGRFFPWTRHSVRFVLQQGPWLPALIASLGFLFVVGSFVARRHRLREMTA